jgi:hypothetical protein
VIAAVADSAAERSWVTAPASTSPDAVIAPTPSIAAERSNVVQKVPEAVIAPVPSIAAVRSKVVQNVPETVTAPVAETAADRSNVVQKAPDAVIAPVAATAAERMWTRIALVAIAPVAAIAAERSWDGAAGVRPEITVGTVTVLPAIGGRGMGCRALTAMRRGGPS